MKILVTGAKGFIGKNLCVFLSEQQHEVLEVNRETEEKDLVSYLSSTDIVFHLAGANRPIDPSDFQTDNVDTTQFITDILLKSNRRIPVVLASSIQAEDDNEYGVSKYAAEKIVRSYSIATGAAYYIYRLPNVFGKWCKPNYNSFIATFCSNLQKGLDISVHDFDAQVRLAYIDDVCAAFMGLLNGKASSGFQKLPIEYNTTVGEVANIILSFATSHTTLIIERVGTELTRALYATYLSYTPPHKFKQSIPNHEDKRGSSAKCLKQKILASFLFSLLILELREGVIIIILKTKSFSL